jgi:hypothetical protein
MGYLLLSVKVYWHFKRPLLNEISSVQKFGFCQSCGPVLQEAVAGFKSRFGEKPD